MLRRPSSREHLLCARPSAVCFAHQHNYTKTNKYGNCEVKPSFENLMVSYGQPNSCSCCWQLSARRGYSSDFKAEGIEVKRDQVTCQHLPGSQPWGQALNSGYILPRGRGPWGGGLAPW